MKWTCCPSRSTHHDSPATHRASGELASAVAFRMEKHGIMAMPVLDDGERLVGVVHLHDLLRARVA